jgi:hypothetical protein
MKKILLTIYAAACLGNGGRAQSLFNTVDSLSVNNVVMALLLHGDASWNPVTSDAFCETPPGSHLQENAAFAVWMSGFDDANVLHVAAETYRQKGVDFWPGPLDDQDTLTYATSYQWAKIWKVYSSDIEAFRALTTHTLASTPASILTWPGKGNSYAEGNDGAPLTITTDMAPFVDLNGNGVYEPLLGEYPSILGDEAAWWVFSDNGVTHSQTSARPLDVEIHTMAYGYKRHTLIDNVIYFDYTVINKSVNNYHDVRFGIFDNPDIGYMYAQLIGFDSTWRMGIGYTLNDIGVGGGHPINDYRRPPLIGVSFVDLPGDGPSVKQPVGSFMYFNDDLSMYGTPEVDTEYSNLMRSKFRNGQHLRDDFIGFDSLSSGGGPGPDCNYVYSGDPTNSDAWSECVSNNNPGKRQFVLSSNDFSLSAGGNAHILVAYVSTDTGQGGCPVVSFDSIRIGADTAWQRNHNEVATSVSTPVVNGCLKVYPDPASYMINIALPKGFGGSGQLFVYNCIGQRVISAPVVIGTVNYTLNLTLLPPGAYELVYFGNDRSYKQEFIKQ